MQERAFANPGKPWRGHGIRSLKNLIHDQVDEEVEPIARSNERQHMDVVNEQHERALFEQAEAAHSLKDLLEKPK